jgi:hypothetical protein
MQRARSRAHSAPELDPERTLRTAAPAEPEDLLLELSDVPAAVVCAVCGKPECQGCLPLDERTNASGVVAILPWERPGLGVLSRLWGTARAMTLSHREVCATLPEGGLAAPLAFALLAESFAALGLLLAFSLFGLLAPELVRLVLLDPELRGPALRALVLGLPAVALIMVLLHSLHGLIVDRAARAAGSTRRGRGLRFGLYACGWDLVTLPLGLLILLFSDGPSAVKQAMSLAVSVPNHAARAYLSGVHGLDQERTARAARRANLGTGLAALGVLATAGIGVVLYLH